MPEEVGYEIVKRGSEEILKINANAWEYSPSIEDSPVVMVYVIDQLAEVPYVSRIVFNQKKNYEYNYKQTQYLVEIAKIYKHLIRQKKVFSLENYGGSVSQQHAMMQYVVYNLLRTDPIGAYVELKRLIRLEKVKVESLKTEEKEGELEFLKLLEYVYDLLDKTTLVNSIRDYLPGYTLGDRALYKYLFRANIIPDFIFTRLMSRLPLDGDQIDAYQLPSADVKVFRLKDDVKLLYHLTPPELMLSEDLYELLSLARSVLAEHKPREEEFLDPEKMRRTFGNIGTDLILELAESKGYDVNYKDVEKLAEILVRYTVGFGMIEILLEDPKIQDIVVNSPVGQTPIYIVHQDYGDCVTNIQPGFDDAESWATKFRLLSGRPLDEANPVLDTELVLPGGRARVAIMNKPLSPFGLAFAFRRHRDKPWTLPLFIQNKMMTPLAAGLISFLVDGSRTMLFGGTRSSGKTSILGASLLEIMRRYRVVTIEDTMEINVDVMRKMGYNIQSMKVRSALTTGGNELSADEGIRTSLRLGDSSLIVGEIRSLEAPALYEAMRVGALANVVAGTIHGDSPYGVYDRVVNDLKVPRTSFKATDIIIISNPVRSADGLHSVRRILSITEVRKHWENDPLVEKGFVELMKYNPELDRLEITDDLKNGDSDVLKSIASRVKGWAGNWDAVWENIVLRGKIKKRMVDLANEQARFDLLECDVVVRSNDIFHKISEEVYDKLGNYDNNEIYKKWDEWFIEYAGKKRL